MGLENERQLEAEYMMPTFARFPVEFVSGEGMRLYDADSREYLDFLAGIGVCSLGHCNPCVTGAICNQAKKLIHVCNYFYIEKRGELAEKISNLLNFGADPDAPSWKTFFTNSGAESNECAIKLARLYAKQRTVEAGMPEQAAPSIIVTLVKSFHGRTLATLAATGQAALHKGFDPIPEGFLPTPINDIESLRGIFGTMGKSICAVMVECIQGESGVHVCTPEFLAEVRALCDEHDALMICDEVQCGIFRTGAPFAFQNYGIAPDIVSMAKGIASGMPMGACSARADIADAYSPGKHGSTFGGSNLAISAAFATLTELERPVYAQNARDLGAYMKKRLLELDGVEEVRGMGLMVGAEIDGYIDAHDVVSAALENGLVINATGPTTLRFLPPLICTSEDVDEFIGKMAKSLA